MSATVSRDIELDGPDLQQEVLPLASGGVVRWVWQGRFGPMLIEVVGESVRVNGEPVEPYRSGGERAGSTKS